MYVNTHGSKVKVRMYKLYSWDPILDAIPFIILIRFSEYFKQKKHNHCHKYSSKSFVHSLQLQLHKFCIWRAQWKWRELPQCLRESSRCVQKCKEIATIMIYINKYNCIRKSSWTKLCGKYSNYIHCFANYVNIPHAYT